MNIFILDRNPIAAAEYVFDTHAVKMCLETFQLLSTSARIILAEDFEKLARPTHENHPCTIWARGSIENFEWLMLYQEALFCEYTDRYGRIHKNQYDYEDSWFFLCRAVRRLGELGLEKMTPFALAMPPVLIVPDPVMSYRRLYHYKAALEIAKFREYYQDGLSVKRPQHRMVWLKGERPSWATFDTSVEYVKSVNR